MKKDIKIAVAGTGYVGMSIATLLSQHHDVTAVDIVEGAFVPRSTGHKPIAMPISW